MIDGAITRMGYDRIRLRRRCDAFVDCNARLLSAAVAIDSKHAAAEAVADGISLIGSSGSGLTSQRISGKSANQEQLGDD